MAVIVIQANPQQMLQLENELREIPKALSSAINKTLGQGKTVALKGLTDATTAKKVSVSKGVYVRKATPKILSGKIVMGKKGIPLTAFKYKDTGRGSGKRRTGQGVFVQVMKSGAPLHYPVGFVGTNLGGTQSVFHRIGKFEKVTKAHYKGNIGKLRERINWYRYVRMSEIYEKLPGLQSATAKKISDIFGEKLRSATDWVLNRKKGERPE